MAFNSSQRFIICAKLDAVWAWDDIHLAQQVGGKCAARARDSAATHIVLVRQAGARSTCRANFKLKHEHICALKSRSSDDIGGRQRHVGTGRDEDRVSPSASTRLRDAGAVSP